MHTYVPQHFCKAKLCFPITVGLLFACNLHFSWGLNGVVKGGGIDTGQLTDGLQCLYLECRTVCIIELARCWWSGWQRLRCNIAIFATEEPFSFERFSSSVPPTLLG